MSIVDNRVVKMTFDNAQFEQGVKTSKKTLEDFEKSLKMDGAAAGFDEISKAAGKVDFSSMSDSAKDAAAGINNAVDSVDMTGIQEGVMDASSGFNVLEEIAIGALRGIGDEIQNLVTGGLASIGNTIKSYTIDPIVDGFKEYETQMGSIQTIIANTGRSFDSDQHIDEVNTALDTLNTYADKTIYKFTDMTNAIGRFTAAGIGKDNLQDAVDAVQGVANVAALSGASTQDVSRVLPQIAQALSSGSVSLQDWASVESANMNSKIYVDAIADVAMHMASIGKAEKSAYEAGNAILNEGMTIRKAINKVENEDWAGWFTSDILANSLQIFTMSKKDMLPEEIEAAKDYFRSLGYTTEEEFERLFEQAELAQRAAQEVRTWSQLWDTIGESIGSNWSQIWRNLLGDFKQATDTFTYLSNTISSGIDNLFSGIKFAAEQFNASGAIDIIFGGFLRDDEGHKKLDENTKELIRVEGAIDHFVQAITKPLSAIGDAWNAIFGFDTNDPEMLKILHINLVSVAKAIDEFAKSLIISDDAATGIRQVFEGLFSVLDIIIHVVLDAVAVFFKLSDVLSVVIGPAIDIVLSLFGQLGKILVWIHDRFLEVRGAIIEASQPFGDIVWSIKEIVSAFFEWAHIPDIINDFGDAVIDVLNAVWQFIDIPGKILGAGKLLEGLVGFISEITGWDAAVEEAGHRFEETGEQISVFDLWISHLLENPIIGFLKAIVDGLINLGNSIGNGLISLISNLAEHFSNLGGALKGLGERLIDFIQGTDKFKDIISKFNEFKDNVTNVLKDLPNRFAKLGPNIAKELGVTENILDTFFKKFDDIIKYFSTVTAEQFIQDVKNKFEEFKKFVGGIVDFFKNLNPDRLVEFLYGNILLKSASFSDILRKIAKGVEATFPELETSLSDGIDKAYSVFANGLFKIKSFINPIAEESNNFPEFIVKLFIRIVEAIGEGINNIITKIQNFKPMDFLYKWFDIGTAIKDTLSNWFPDLEPVFNNIYSKFTVFFASITLGAENWQESLRRIGQNVIDFITGIPESIKNFTPEDLFSSWMDVGTKIKDTLSNWIPNLAPTFEEKHAEITGFFDSVTSDADSWQEVLSRIGEKIVEAFTHIPEVIGNIVSTVAGFAANVVSSILEFFSGFEGPLGELFGALKEKFDNLTRMVADFFSNFGKEEGGSPLDMSNSGISVGVKTFGDNLKEFKDKFTGFGDIVSDISDKFKSIIDKIKSIFTMENIQTIVGVIKDLAVIKNLLQGSKLIKGLTDVTKSASGLINSYSNLIDTRAKNEKQQTTIELLKSMALFMATLAGAIWVISTIPDPWTAVGVLGAVSVLLLAVQALSALITKIGNGSEAMLQASESILILALGILAMMFAIEQLTRWDWMANIQGIALASLFMIAFAGFTRLLGNGGENAVKAAVGFAIMALAIGLLIEPLQRLTEFAMSIDENKWTFALGAVAALALFILAMGESSKLAGEHGIGAAVSFIALGVAIGMITDALVTLADLHPGMLLESLVALAGIIGEFGYIANKTGGMDIMVTAGAMIIYAESVKMLSEALVSLASNKWEQVAAAGGAIAAIVYVFERLTKVTEGLDILATAGAMIAYSYAIVVLSQALLDLSAVPADALVAPTAALASLVVVFERLAEVTNGVDILATAGAMAIYSASIVIISAALAVLSEVPWDKLTPATIALSALIAVFGILAYTTGSIDLIATSTSIVIFAAAIGLIAISLGVLSTLDSEAITNAATALGALVSIFGLIALLTNGVDLIATAGAITLFGAALLEIAYAFILFNEALATVPDFDTIYNAGYNIVAGLGAGIIDGVGFVVEKILGIGQAILDSILNFFGIHSPSTVMQEQVGQFIPEGIGVGITDGIPNLLEVLGGLFTDILNWVKTDGLNTLREALTSFWGWFTTEGIPMLKNVLEELIKFLGELLSSFWNWFTTEGLPMLGQALSDFWNWFTTDGLKMLGELLGEILKFLGDLLAKFWDWFTKEGLPALGRLLEDFWHWFTTDGLKMLGELIKTIFEKLGELLVNLGKWVINDGLPAIGRALGDLMEEAGKIGGMIIEWASHIPEYIADAIAGIWKDITDVGASIVDGIAEGISNAPQALVDSITDIGGQMIDGFCNFFGINSPSRKMMGLSKYIPEGVGEGILKNVSYAVDAAENMGNATIDAVNSTFSNLDSPSISPVFDAGRFSDELRSYGKDLSDLSAMSDFNFGADPFSLSYDLASNLDYQKEMLMGVQGLLGEMNEMLFNSNERAEALYGRADDWFDSMQSTTSNIEEYVRRGGNVYMDSGSLVGAIAYDMDRELGLRQVMSRRGGV